MFNFVLNLNYKYTLLGILPDSIVVIDNIQNNSKLNSNRHRLGSSMDIVIRGSATGETHPLYVNYNIPIGAEYNIKPDEIENISILKNASAVGIGHWNFGRVIIITTKIGRSKNRSHIYDAIPQYQYNPEPDFTQYIVQQLQLLALKYIINEHITMLYIITEKGEA
jgi:hypothetical protein